MTLPAYVLDESAAVVLNASGAGVVTIGPKRPLQTWAVTNVAVTVSSNTNEPIAEVFLGPVAAGNKLGGTFSGSNDNAPINTVLRNGNILSVRWTGGDAGARATVSVYGQLFTGRQ